MENFFTDNSDIQWYMHNMDMAEVICHLEDDFTDRVRHLEAPDSVADAMESYRIILELTGALAAQEIAPVAADVDREGAQLNNGQVSYAKGTQKALDLLNTSNLMGFTLPRRYGGLNMPGVTYTIATEMISQADASLMNLFGLQDIGDTIKKFADDMVKDKYLPLFAKENASGAMDLTEPDAGSDLQAVNLKAVQAEDGTWKLYGVKRFITNGCGDISLVLARSEEGTKDGRGLSMFLCEKCPELVVRRIEDKLGIHGSPTCELQFNGVPGILIGQRRRGLIKYVMSLMNGARIAIAAQSTGIAQAAYEEALKYARERVQFKKPIIAFPQIYDMLVRMKMGIQASRAITYTTSALVDLKDAYQEMIDSGTAEQEIKQKARKLEALLAVLTPISKGYASEMCNQATYDAIQIHGGAGYMRDFNVERHARDARITTIYEGTTQLQVIGALGGLKKGVLCEYLDTLDGADAPAGLSDLVSQCTEMRQILKNALQYLKDKNDTEYTDLAARALYDMASEALAAHLLLNQAILDEERKLVAEKIISDALTVCRNNAQAIHSGIRLTIDHHEALL